MKTALLLNTLQNQMALLREQATPLMGHATLKPRFDRQLFRTRSTLIKDYLDEAQANLDELRHAVQSEHTEQVAWLAEHLTEQITALHREIAAWPLRMWDSAASGAGKWQRKRLENQEFERRLFEMKRERETRLFEMKRERETRLNNSETLEEQQLLMREITALEGRLIRCRQALDEIERVIERLTR
ncbi:primosomal replication protein N'' [Enterobacter soli]|uniref:primosomal replication protein N'' n=1 Tax=Enterobacter soli TaxID=885040 RepID=UPI002F41887A